MSFGLYETSRCAPPGRVEHTLAVEFGAKLRDSSGVELGFWGERLPVPMYALHLGLFRNCDLGLRLGVAAAGLSAKYTFWDGEPSVAFVADASGSIALIPMALVETGRAFDGRLLVSGGYGTLGYAASIGAGHRYRASGFEFGRTVEQSWDITASGGLPVTFVERVRIMPVLSVGLPVWTSYLEYEFLESTRVWANPDVQRLSASLGVSLSLLARDHADPEPFRLR